MKLKADVTQAVHLYAVGELAAHYASLTSDSIPDFPQRYRISVCRVAGYAHQLMESGCSFEDVVQIADEAVARIVAAVTPDVRYPEPRRMELFANQVGLAPVDAQLVKFADIGHQLQAPGIAACVAAFDALTAANWFNYHDRLLLSLHHVRGHDKLKTVWSRFRSDLRALMENRSGERDVT